MPLLNKDNERKKMKKYKIKTTIKNLKANFPENSSIAISYCNLQTLLRVANVKPFAYTAGVYGWNFDAYDVDDVLLTTGYRGTFGKRASYELCHKFELAAREIEKKYDFEHLDAAEKAGKRLLRRFISEALGTGGE